MVFRNAGLGRTSINWAVPGYSRVSVNAAPGSPRGADRFVERGHKADGPGRLGSAWRGLKRGLGFETRPRRTDPLFVPKPQPGQGGESCDAAPVSAASLARLIPTPSVAPQAVVPRSLDLAGLRAGVKKWEDTWT